MIKRLKRYASNFDLVRLRALIRKEFMQMIRDPSTFIVAGLLPALMLFLFATAVSLDIKNIPIAVVKESNSVKAQSLYASYTGSPYFIVHSHNDLPSAKREIIRGTVRGIVIIPADFDTRLTTPSRSPIVEIISDGAQPNTARFVGNAAMGVFRDWLAANKGQAAVSKVDVVPRFWFNQELNSKITLIPGAIAIVMTMIGTLLTSMVVAREWERGTMEALMATPSNIYELLVGKIIPYFGLGLISVLICVFSAIYFFDVPMQGSWFALLVFSSAFLIPALGQGLWISSTTKNQFAASQIALFLGWLPAMMFSGFIYEISGMPLPLRILSNIFPATYYVDAMRTLFLVGDNWKIFAKDIFFMLLIGVFFMSLSIKASFKTLDGK